MKNNELSFESLYMHGMGGASIDDHPRSNSVEAFDGFEDAASIELAHAMESLDFMGTYEAINSKLTADKIRMCKRLAVNYGKNSSLLNKQAANSIESLCLQHSLEAEAEAVTSTGAKTNTKPNTGTTEKKKNYFKAIFSAIKTVFEKIINFFQSLFNKIAEMFSNLLDRAPAKDVDYKLILKALNENKNIEKIKESYLIINGSMDFDGKSRVLVDSCDKLIELTKTKAKTFVKKSDTGSRLKQDTDLENVKNQIVKNFGSMNIEDKAMNPFLKCFGVKVEKSDNIEPAVKWAASGANVKRAVEDLKKLIKGSVKKFSDCAHKCDKYADVILKSIENVDFNADTLNIDDLLLKTISDTLKDIAKMQQKYSGLVSTLSKSISLAYKMNIMGQKAAKKPSKENTSDNEQ